MGIVLLENMQMKVESYSYIDAMHAVLLHKRWTSFSKPMLAGMTVSGFRFTVNRRLTSESSTAYNWMAENFLAADFIGVASSQNAGYSFSETFPLYQKNAIKRIVESIDRGMGAIFWKDQFVIAAGYHEKSQILYYLDGSGDEYKQMPYSSFGINVSPYWYYQVLEARIEMDESAIFKESFMQAIYKWESHDLMLPIAEYGCGKSAYDVIIHALQTGDYDLEDARVVFNIYAAFKSDIRRYFESLQRIWPQLNRVAEYYTRLDQLFGRIVTSEIADGMDLFEEARQTEEQAIQFLKGFMRETVDNRFNDIALR